MKSKIQLIPTGGMSRDEWLSYRHTGIGASEVGTILGLDDYTSSLELYYYKIGEVPKFDTERMAQFMGREQEDLIARLWQYWDGSEESMISNFRAGKIVRRCQRVVAYVRNPEYPWLYVSLDRKINKHGGRGEGTLELKTISGFEADKWESGLPPKYVTQVQTQMAVCEFLYGEMAILLDGRRMEVLPFELSDTIVQHVITRTKEFWNRVVEGRKLVNEKYQALVQFNQKRADECTHEIDKLAPEPDGTLAYADYLKERFSKPNKLERAGSDEEFMSAKIHQTTLEAIKTLEEQKNMHESALKKAMGDNVQVIDFGGNGKVYWHITQSGKRFFRNKIKV